jgi:hypothetical protein
VRGLQIPKPIPLTRIAQARAIRPLPPGEVRKLRGRITINMIEIWASAFFHDLGATSRLVFFARGRV